MIYKGKQLKKILKEAVEVKEYSTTVASFKIYELGDFSYEPNAHIGDHYITQYSSYDYFLNKIMTNYETTKQKVHGYKIVYLKAKGRFTGYYGNGVCNIYIPTLAEVEIPYHSVIYSGNKKEGKCRANQAVITKVIEPKQFHDMRQSQWYDAQKEPFPVFVQMPDGKLETFVGEIMYDQSGHAINKICSPNRIVIFFITYWDVNMKDIYSGYELQEATIDYKSEITGYNISLSFHNSAPSRKIGEKIVIDDFNILPVTCSRGFHFFKNLDDALKYF